MRATHNHSNLKSLRRQLRSESPSAEKELWKHIRRKQVHGYKFRRQYSIGPYVVDFCCPELKLIIETDGITHFTNLNSELKDRHRQESLEGQKFILIRFTNTDIYDNLDNTLNYLYETVADIAKL